MVYFILGKIENLGMIKGVFPFPLCPGGGLGKQSDRDQHSWVLLDNQIKYIASDRKPKNILSKKQNPKKYSCKHDSLRRSSHDMMIMKDFAY